MRSKSIISLILCAVMLLCMLVSCDLGGKDAATTSGDSTTDAPKDSVSDTVPESTEPETDNRGFPNDNLPDKRFNDVVSILTWSNQIAYEFDSDKDTQFSDVFERADSEMYKNKRIMKASNK